MIGHLIATAAATLAPDAFGAVLQAIAPPKTGVIEAWQLAALGSLQDSLERKRVSITSYESSTNAAIKQSAGNIKAAFVAARGIAQDTKAESAAREASIRLLGRGFNNAASDLPIAVSFIKPGTQDKLLQAAIEVVRRNTSPKVPEMLLVKWSQQSPALRASIIDLLLGREPWTTELLNAVERGVVGVSEISPANKQRLLKSKSEEIVRRTDKLLTTKREGRAELIARYQDVVDLKGVATKGAEVFAKNCASCHSLGGQGNEVGPDLRPFKNKPVQDYLVAILDPNSVIEPRFTLYMIDTKDDRALSGVVVNETATSLTLVQPAGVRETILRKDIAKFKASTLSLMPEGLEAGITPQDMADLIAWIRGTTQ
jgi:putative heme-binding domain-containing protein